MKKAMKAMAVLLLLAVGAMFAASCGDKDGDEVSIVGSWKYVSYTEFGTTFDANGTWTFGEDGKLTVEIGGSPSSGNYIVDGDKLIWDFGYGQVTNEILVLTKTDLSIKSGDRDVTYYLKRN